MAGDHVDHENNSDAPDGGPVKTFLEHLEDFRWVMAKSLVTLGLAMLVCLCGAQYVVQILKWPLSRAPRDYAGTNQVLVISFGTNRIGNFQISAEQQQALNLGSNRFVAVQVEPITLGTNQVLGWHVDDDPQAIREAQHAKVDLVNLSPAGGFFVAFQVAFYAGMILAAPFIFYFIASFIFPALKLKERKYVYRGMLFGGSLFMVGVSFCYFVLMPLVLTVSQAYSNWLGFGAFQWRAEEYISFVCKFMLGMGLGFEMPVVLLVLVKLDVLNYARLRGMWRYMIVINLILGGVLTTPEVATQIAMFVPLYMLYELSVWIAWYWEQSDRARARRVLALALIAVSLLLWLIWMGVQYGLAVAHHRGH